MTWVRFDDGYREHDKIVYAGKAGRELHEAMIFYCARNLTNGLIHENMIAKIAAAEEISNWRDALDRLMAVLPNYDHPLVYQRDSGYFELHDYLEYQPSKEHVLSQRMDLSAKRAMAGRQGGLRSGETRRRFCEATKQNGFASGPLPGDGLGSDEAGEDTLEATKQNTHENAKQNEANAILLEANGQATEANMKQKGSPVPVPHKIPPIPPSGGDGEEKLSQREKMVLSLPVTLRSRFLRWYDIYPVHKGPRKAMAAFKKLAPSEEDTDRMIAAVQEQKTGDPQWLKEDGQFIPHPASWLNAGGWDNEVQVAGVSRSPNFHESALVDEDEYMVVQGPRLWQETA